MVCSIKEVSRPADMNISLQIKGKDDTFGQLLRIRHLLYPKDEFILIPIIIGALRFVNKYLKNNLDKLGFSKR